MNWETGAMRINDMLNDAIEQRDEAWGRGVVLWQLAYELQCTAEELGVALDAERYARRQAVARAAGPAAMFKADWERRHRPDAQADYEPAWWDPETDRALKDAMAECDEEARPVRIEALTSTLPDVGALMADLKGMAARDQPAERLRCPECDGPTVVEEVQRSAFGGYTVYVCEAQCTGGDDG